MQEFTRKLPLQNILKRCLFGHKLFGTAAKHLLENTNQHINEENSNTTVLDMLAYCKSRQVGKKFSRKRDYNKFYMQ